MVNWHRDKKPGRTIALDQITPRLALEDGPDESVEREETKESLLQAIRRLPADRQQLLVLKFVEQYSNKQIGKVLGRSEGAIKSLYHRTLVSLRSELGDEIVGKADALNSEGEMGE